MGWLRAEQWRGVVRVARTASLLTMVLVWRSATAQAGASIRVRYEASAGVATETGLYIAPGTPGAAHVVARNGPLTSRVNVTVVAPPDTGETSRGEPWLDEDFSRYTSPEQYRTNPFGWLAPSARWWHQERISFGPGYGGSPHSLQYNWPGDIPPRSQCSKDVTIETGYKLPRVREVWIEAVHKFDPTFDTNRHCGVKGYKFLLIWRTVGDRFALFNGFNGHEWWSSHPATHHETLRDKCSGLGFDCQLGYGTGQTQFLSVIPGNLWDGQWHTYRAHIKLPNEKGEKTGVFELWIDGTLVKRVVDQDFILWQKQLWSNRLEFIALGSNSNSGTSRPTQTYWGRLRVWTADPKW